MVETHNNRKQAGTNFPLALQVCPPLRALLFFGEIVINRIEEWIDSINAKYQSQRKSCSIFSSQFSGFYSERFLEDSYFVVVENIPKPNFPELREAGLGDFIDMEVNGITYKNTYYVHARCVDELRLHFHELVHVVQWGLLSAHGFINRYISEIQNHGYNDAPLEQMAYALDGYYSQGGKPMDVPSYVQSKCNNPINYAPAAPHAQKAARQLLERSQSSS